MSPTIHPNMEHLGSDETRSRRLVSRDADRVKERLATDDVFAA